MLSITSRRAKIEAIALAVAAALYAIYAAVSFVYRFNFEARRAAFTVLEKRIDHGRLLVVTNIHTYQCVNSALFWKWDAAATFAALEVGRTYTADVVGFRVELLGWYPSILTAADLSTLILPQAGSRP